MQIVLGYQCVVVSFVGVEYNVVVDVIGWVEVEYGFCGNLFFGNDLFQ